jgi:hypothetical protein
MNEPVLLTLIAPTEIEELLVDWLLDHDHRGFTSFDCAGHGVATAELSSAEQVSGRKRRVGFWLALPRDESDRLVARLARTNFGPKLHYWSTRLLAAGPLEGGDGTDDARVGTD